MQNTIMLRVTLFALLVCSSAFSTPLDDLIDEALWEAGQNFAKKGMDKIELPHFTKEFHEKIIGPLAINGEIFVENGIFKNLSSIYRAGPVGYENKTDGTIVVTLSLGLKDVEMRYDFGYKVMFFSSHKTIDAQCTENSITVQMSLLYDDQKNCKVTLNRATLDQLGGFIINITPSGIISNLESRLLSSGLNQLAITAKSFINQNLQSMLSNIMNKFDVCSMLPF